MNFKPLFLPRRPQRTLWLLRAGIKHNTSGIPFLFRCIGCFRDMGKLYGTFQIATFCYTGKNKSKRVKMVL
jgi:hypothetical protein